MGKCLFMRKGETHSAPNGLPSGYTKLTYIESSVTQYIDTEFKPNQDTRVVLDVEITGKNESLAANDMFGCRTSVSSKAYAVQWSMTNKCFQHFYNDGLDGLSFGDFTRQIIEMNKNVLSLNGITHERTYSTFQCDYSMYLFALNNAGTAAFFSKMRVYSCQIYDNGTLIRDFIPCINSNGEVGLYDTVNKKFYGNKGTGVFTYENAPISGILASDISVGSTVKLMENGNPIEYLVVNQGIPSSSSLYDSSCNGTWLLRKDCYTKYKWDGTNNDYKNSDIHSYLNGTFFNLFDETAKNAIKQVKIPHVNGTGTSAVSSGANGLTTKVFLLGIYEVGWDTTYSEYLPVDSACLSYFISGVSEASKKLRISYLNNAQSVWWLRSPYSGDALSVWYVDGAGGCGFNYYTDTYGVRPCVILPPNALFDETTLVLKGVA